MTEPSSAALPLAGHRQRALLGTFLILLGIGSLAFLGPQHRVSVKQLNWCWAPDCKSSVSSDTKVCAGLERLKESAFPDAGVLIAFAVILVLQLLAFLLRSRGLHLAAGITSIVGALLGLIFVAAHSVGEHLFSETHILWGEVVLIATLFGLLGAGIAQIIIAATNRRA